MENSRVFVSDEQGMMLNVQTKFKLGDLVYVYDGKNKIYEREIVKVNVKIEVEDTGFNKLKVSYICKETCGEYRSSTERDEKDLYSSRDEIKDMLHSMIDNL